MWTPLRSALVTLAALAGFVSAGICQFHMVVEEHAASSHHDGHGRDGHPHDSPSDDPCCLILPAEVKAVDSIAAPSPLAFQKAEAVHESSEGRWRIDRSLGWEALAHKPPGSRTLLEQTCALLI